MKRLFFLLLLIVVLVVFRQWFSCQPISSGDYRFFFKESLHERFSLPFSWKEGYQAPFLNSYLLIFTTGLLSKLGLGFVLIERLVWFWLFLILTFFSSWYLAKTIFFKNKTFFFLTPLIYFFNSYILMVISGGQVGIITAYALAPLILAFFIKSLVEKSLKLRVASGLILAFQVAFDPRIAFITIGAVFLYALFQFGLMIKKYAKSFTLPFFIALGIHCYWLLPTILVKRSALPVGYGASGWVKFLSFADFSKTFSLLHPNWPENIFGKTYFMRPEFLIIPILAFVSLLFVNRLKNLQIKKNILSFTFLALIGVFLAKGSNPPFGEAYLWLFNNFPGMNLFRDSTKFYVLIALSYSILIPFSIAEIYKRLKTMCNTRRITHYLPGLFAFFVVCYLLLLIKPAILGQLGGTFKTKEVPQDYIQFKGFIGNQNEFFRTFWVPKEQRFGFFANNHPAISAESFVTDSVCQEPFCSLKEKMSEEWSEECLPNDRCYVRELSYFLNPKTAEALSLMAVKYVIVPFDSEGEIFLAERKYNHQQRKEVEEFLDTIFWLKKIDVTDRIAVYETPSHKDHFFILDKGINHIDWTTINSTKYVVRISGATQPFNLVFSETYDELWQAKIGETVISSREWNNLNSFFINQTGNLEITIEFTAQKYVYLGGIISLITLLLAGRYLVFSFRQVKS